MSYLSLSLSLSSALPCPDLAWPGLVYTISVLSRPTLGNRGALFVFYFNVRSIEALIAAERWRCGRLLGLGVWVI